MLNTQHLCEAFSAHFPGSGAPGLCRAPGRVNLIGEHVDYNGLPVLPIAIDREIRAAFAARKDGKVQLRSLDAGFPPADFHNARKIPPSAPGAWENYAKAAIQGLNVLFNMENPPGLDIMVTGDIPVAAGLSSSSALVVAISLAYLRVLGKTLEKDITRIKLAECLAEAEQYVGTRGGGMDQAIILLAREGHAAKIDFHPLRTAFVPTFKDYVFVVCDSLVKARKSGGARHAYNEGPLSCRLLCALVEKTARMVFDSEVEIARLGDLWHGPLCLTDKEVSELFEQTFPDSHVTLDKAAHRLEITPNEIRERFLGDLPVPAEGLPLKARARHQLTEYRRVETARDAMLAGQPDVFGALMTASHRSCADDYRVSCPELDRLVDAALQAGAIGARLTGAGFGGCTVNLTPAKQMLQFKENLDNSYYRGIAHGSAPIHVVQPASGASYLDTP